MMNQIEELQKQWRDKFRFRGLHASMSLEEDGLVLGAKTVLAKRDHDGALALEGAEAQLLTLLAVAYGRPVDAAVLGKIRRASHHAQAGDAAMAAMHIALAGLPQLADPVDAARRLFIADGLLADGVTPRDIFAALEFDPAPLDELEKYNPSEPRNPKGSGVVSGRWTSGGASASVAVAAAGRGAQWAAEEVATAIRAQAVRMAARLAALATEAASRVAPPVAFVTELFDSSGLGGSRVEGAVRDFPDLRYSRYQDETALNIVSESDGHTILTLYPLGRGTFIDRGHGIVAHMEDDELVIGPQAVPIPQVRAQERTEDPDECPEQTDDRPGRVGPAGEKDKDYEDYVKHFVNPIPTPRGIGYAFPNPLRPSFSIIFDDCQHATGDLYDAKSTGYAKMLAENNPYLTGGLAKKFVKQATDQIVASEGREIVWCFAEKEAADFVRELFDDEELNKSVNLRRIRIVYLYWREGMK